jgi:hypothetical protein
VSNFRVTFTGRIISTSGDLDAAVADPLHAAMAELHKIGTRDPAIMLDIKDNGRLIISCSVSVAELKDAVPPADVDIRTSLQAAGIGTPGWESAENDHRWKVEFINTNAEALVAA